ncbi:MAG TPA: carboxypeptidase M32 [Candidatus Hydrogenedentes bacterium]|nr:carboxypeptidase M32 [Candidatus Hydrogenedentota bacterium]HOL76633.1 carboxypeptidase M32 [Candidatus Hydrogenedentota bacterium]HPO84466.1 carboxypeptidase M32 [Candidatus Hydrogenedentota bacterium]
MPETLIATLREKLGTVCDLRSAARLLEWDQETYMPPKAAEERAQQLATLSALAHSLFVSPEIGALLEKLIEKKDKLSQDDAVFVDVVRYDYERARRLPDTFVHSFTLETSRALQVWIEARKRSDFSMFLPCLERVVALNREKAEYLGYAKSPYDALLEDFERGMSVETIRPLFQELAEGLTKLVARISARPAKAHPSWLAGEWPEVAKLEFSKRVLTDLGYDMEAGRQDKSVHPFSTSIGLCDVRITTRTTPDDLFKGLMATIHECGHALYSQGHDPKDQRTPLLDGASLGTHESQSRLWENFIGRSLPFWRHYLPVLRQYFPGRLDHVCPENVYEELNRVVPSCIRVDADECTYNLHIFLRFEIEVDLIENQVSSKEVPEIWNEKMKAYLGIDVPNAAQGCLQDIHWSHGAFGYFPTYALGNIYAAQFLNKMTSDIPSLWDQVASGDFSAILAWLREKVHRHNRRKLAAEILREATGQDVSVTYFLNYLEKKYSDLYNL